ncbi:MAG: hypothetical protein A2788_00455 [Candidatus Abawacabacteria bacterium RIFCSPHIGHO2_01_FULL_46_8]|uniref:Uncharacterized protein n=1 Tax=Candidatus Abawacabacteria bacterium RIFCSPHIGHO2_01_FULL_46_8 TaxID=1817815 RepID=A0A1F4XMX8_9BACT|nr:MAG: hypothetical protein A2788_00455 [Candidatus Abawacabacteria bacterium RIFCSPHIGHO2_01_FULL_46_8]
MLIIGVLIFYFLVPAVGPYLTRDQQRAHLGSYQDDYKGSVTIYNFHDWEFLEGDFAQWRQQYPNKKVLGISISDNKGMRGKALVVKYQEEK